MEARVEKLVFGGKGLIRHEGWVIFIPGVLPGELVQFEITEKKKSYLEAKLLAVLEPSPDRVNPPCPYFGRCGGCQLQHIAYSEQLRLKKEWLIDALQKIGKIKIDFPVNAIPAKKEWEYRQKVTLHGPQKGFYALDNSTIIPIDRCLIFSKNGFDNTRKIEAKNKTIVLKELQDEKEVLGLTIYFSPTVFMQNDPEQALQIYQDVLNELSSGPVLDLYCGVGILSLLAAQKGHEVLGIELDKEAIECAQKSAKKNGLQNARFKAMPCEALSAKDAQKFTQWIVNPPRTGVSTEVLRIISKHKPKRLLYISCMPATLARDAKFLYEHGYKLQKATCYDMFAQTTHLETLALFMLE